MRRQRPLSRKANQHWAAGCASFKSNTPTVCQGPGCQLKTGKTRKRKARNQP